MLISKHSHYVDILWYLLIDNEKRQLRYLNKIFEKKIIINVKSVYISIIQIDILIKIKQVF